MSYASLAACVADLERTGRLRRVDVELDPRLEIPAVQRLACAAGGPALLFTRVRGTRFPMLANLFATVERARYVLRHGYRAVEAVMDLKARPGRFWRYPTLPFKLLDCLPRRVATGPVLACRTRLGELPQLVCWPEDGGAFLTLPQVYTEPPGRPGWLRSNLGMYRCQISGNDYLPDRECGLHYQLHRGIGIHHAAALERGEPLPVNVFLGGPPALTLAAVMPLPEGLPEVAFAGLLAGRPLHWAPAGVLSAPVEADFCLVGRVVPGVLKPEGPFGDHLGYYSLRHDFPVLEVEAVYHRPDAIFPFTTVGRPPQEDSVFGQVIHELTRPVLPTVLPGVHAVNAVDEAGVHPLLLALASERYTPYQRLERPQELLTAAHAMLGHGQLSLAKYLFLAAREDDPRLDVHDVPAFLRHLLERVDWRTDLHFQTQTTLDTLDYSSGVLHRGSKLVVAAVGPARRVLGTVPPEGFALVMPGVLATVEGDCSALGDEWPLVVRCDDPRFLGQRLANFLWVTFTRSDPARDIRGVGEFCSDKHWGCTGALIVDARRKPHHAPVLEEDPAALARARQLAAPGGPLHGVY